MRRDRDPYALSELEREFELEMDDPVGQPAEELEAEFEALFKEDRPEDEFEYGEDQEYESPYEDVSEYANRFYELSQREFESEAEADDAVNALLTEMEQEYFFGTLKKAFRKLKSTARGLARSRRTHQSACEARLGE